MLSFKLIRRLEGNENHVQRLDTNHNKSVLKSGYHCEIGETPHKNLNV